MKKFVFYIFIVLTLTYSFSFTYNKGQNFKEYFDVYFLSLSISNGGVKIGVNYSKENDVIITIKKKVFLRTIKVKMKVKEENFLVRLLYFNSPEIVTEYKIRTLFPIKSESYVLYSVSEEPFLFQDSFTNFSFLGYRFMYSSTKLNDLGYTFAFGSYKNINLGFFSSESLFAGLGATKKNSYAVFGIGWDKGVPSLGVSVLTAVSTYHLGLGFSIKSSGMNFHLFLRKPLKDNDLVFLLSGGKFLVGIHAR